MIVILNEEVRRALRDGLDPRARCKIVRDGVTYELTAEVPSRGKWELAWRSDETRGYWSELWIDQDPYPVHVLTHVRAVGGGPALVHRVSLRNLHRR